MSYNGNRAYSGRSRRSSEHMLAQTMGRAALFPALLVYLELVLHIYMGDALAYAPVYVVFGLAGGLFCSALCMPWRRLANGLTAKILASVISLVYIVEIIAKSILQNYYAFSSLGLAAGNKLSDYADVILGKVLSSIPVILLILLPAIGLWIFGGRLLGFDRLDIRFAGLVLAGAAVFHLAGLGVIHLSWKGDLTPKMLYHMATNMDDQVEQLGMWTMLRLDLKHMVFPPSNTPTGVFSGLDNLGGGGGDKDPSSSGSQVPGGDASEPVPPPVDTSPNVMDVDLEGLAASTSDSDVKWLAEYFNSVTPTKKNQYTGMFEGYNVIQLVLEGFSGYAIDKDLTPTLYKLTHEGFVFNNFYTALHFTSTSNGECQTLLGMYPRNGQPATMTYTGKQGTNAYFSLAQQLGKKGYLVEGFHANGDMYGRQLSHDNLGYHWMQFGSGLEGLDLNDSGKLMWPQRDKKLIEASIDSYLNSSAPFHVYYLTISGHTPYSNHWTAQQYQDIVSALPYSEKTRNYVATAIEVDRALEYLLNRLEQAGKLDKTLIVAAADHVPYGDVDVLEELAGKSFGDTSKLSDRLDESALDFDLYKNSLILWSSSMEETVEVDKVVCQVDILPTVSNLLGLEYDSRMLDGTDALSDSEGLAVFTSKCWRSDRGFYNRFTQTFTPAEGVSMTAEEQDSYVSAMKKLVGYKLDSTHMVVTTDFFSQVFGKESKWVNPAYR